MTISKLAPKLLVGVATVIVMGANAPHAVAQQTTQDDQTEAQTQGEERHEIVVTARRREELLQDVPVSITAIGGDELATRGIQSVNDLQGQVSGLQINSNSRSQSTPSFAIRGQRQEDVSPTTDPTVGIYFADVPLARPNGANGSLFDMQSVQVLKGPQGTLFGRNTTGGAVLFTPNAPEFQHGGSVRITAGDYNLIDVEGIVNLPISNAAALRVSGKITKRDGYMINAETGRDSNNINNTGVRAYLRIQPSDDFISDTIASYFHADDNGTAQRLIDFDPAGFPIPPLRPVFSTVAQQAIDAGKYEFYTTPYTTNEDEVFELFSKVETYSIQNTTEFDISDNISIKNIIAYRDVTSDGLFDLNQLSLLMVKTLPTFSMNQFSNELQFIGEAGDLQWLLGLFYFREAGDDNSASTQFRNVETFSSDAFVRNKNKSAFAHIDYMPSYVPGLTLSAGIRYNDDERLTRVKPRRPVADRFTYICLDNSMVTNSLSGEACPEFEGTANFDKITYDLTAAYEVTPNINIYGTHRRGYRSGAIFSRALSVASLSNPTRPEVVDDFEIGVKTQFYAGGADIRFNIAAYHGDYRDLQRTVSLVQNGELVSNYVNAAKGSVQGADVELDVNFDGLQLGLAYSYTDAKYDEFFDTINVNGVPTLIDVSDSAFPYTPEHSVTANLSYTFPLGADVGDLRLTAAGYYQSKFTPEPINTSNCGPGGVYTRCQYRDMLFFDGYATLNLRADWENALGSALNIGAFVTNVTDEYYYNAGQFQLQNIGTFIALPGAPRMWGASVGFKY